MSIVLNGTTGITNDGGYTGDGVVFADTTPANTLVTTTGGNVGIGITYGLSRLTVAGQSAGADGAYATGRGSIVLNETNRTSVNDTGGFEFKTSVFGSGYGAKIMALDNGTLVFGNRDNSATYTERARIDSSGNLLVGATSGPGRLHVRTAGNTGGDWGAQIVNSSSTLMFALLNNGNFYTGSAAGSPYNATTGAGANCVIDADQGRLLRSTSSLKYKTDVQDAAHGLAQVMALRPVTYKGINDGDKVFGGLIAEEVHEAGLTEFVQYAEDGTPDALAYANMVSLAFKAIQEQQAIITDQDVKMGQLVDQLTNAESTMNLLTEMFTESQQTVAALTARVEALEGTQP
jgi:hypothetical protein